MCAEFVLYEITYISYLQSYENRKFLMKKAENSWGTIVPHHGKIFEGANHGILRVNKNA